MGEDESPLVTPVEAGKDGKMATEPRETERLLTPDSEREVPRSSPHSQDSRDALGKRKAADSIAANELGRANSYSEVQRTNSTLSIQAATSDMKYKKIKKVGVGAYGSVFMAENTETNEIVGVKFGTRKEDPMLGGFPLSVIREIRILRSLSHENIVKIHEVTSTPTGEPLIVMEFCQASLLELLNWRAGGDLSFSEVKYIVRQVLDATRHMHERGILHRDLATKNVLFNLSGEIKVCDFGISRIGFAEDEEFGQFSAKTLEDPNMIVSLPYRAVELLLGKKDYGPALDVWSSGCIFGEVLLCQGGRRRTFFGGDAGNVNKTPQALLEEIFAILGKPTEDTWPLFFKLPLWKSLSSNSAKIERLASHRDIGDEKIFLRKFFTQGGGKCAHTKYVMSDTTFDLMGGLLALDPARRLSARDALQHPLFNEKPLPEWHAWHWATISKEIPRGDDMKKQGSREAEEMLRELSRDDPDKPEEIAKSAKERAKEALDKRVAERRQMEEQQLEARRRATQGASGGGDGEKLPSGWTKHWSSSKQRYYYHDKRTSKNQWHPPGR